MTDSNKVLLDLVRLGLKGDGASVRRYARALLRTYAQEHGAESEFAIQLSKLLVSESAVPQVVRGVALPVVAQLPAEVSGLLRVEEGGGWEAPVLAAGTRAALDQIVVERGSVALLADRGLEPTKALLLVGPPGVGKTMAARHLAEALGLPLVSVELGAVMSSYLGRSGHNLHEAITYAKLNACVFFIDEFDAIAKRRDDPADVGELKRIVNLLLLEIDRWPATGLLVAATNHPELLDRAIWRRFDKVVELAPPDEASRLGILEREFARYGLEVERHMVERAARITEGASGSDIARMVQATARAAVVQGESDAGPLFSRSALDHLLKQAEYDVVARRMFCTIAHKELHWTQREIAAALRISHVTVGNILRSEAVPRGKTRGARVGKN